MEPEDEDQGARGQAQGKALSKTKRKDKSNDGDETVSIIKFLEELQELRDSQKQSPLAYNLKAITSLAEFTLQQARDLKSVTKQIIFFLNGLLEEEIEDLDQLIFFIKLFVMYSS